MKIIAETELITIVDNERDYDFIGYIENKSNQDIKIVFNDSDYEDDPIKIKANDWIGLLANSTERHMFEMIKNNEYTIEWENDDYDE